MAALALLSLGALGVVFGDIGTSPMYAFREAFVASRGLVVERASVLGILSLLFLGVDADRDDQVHGAGPTAPVRSARPSDR